MKRGIFVFWSCLVAVAVMRVVGSLDYEAPSIEECVKKDVASSGTIVTEPERRENGQIFVVRGNICEREILVRVKAKLYPRYEYGDLVSFEGKINKPFNFRSETGRTFDYEGFLAKDNVFFEIKSAEVQKIGDSQDWINVRAILFALKRGFVANLERVLGEPHAALAAGLVVGEKSALGKELLEDFRTVGLIHIVVLSGYNITIVADALRRTLSFLPRVWGIAAGGIGISLFGILVGGGATVVRSCLMAAVALLGDLLRRTYSVGRALIFAGALMIIQSPMILFHDPSFQLSFLATLGLILLSKPVEDRLTIIPEKFGLRGIVATTFATQIFVSPYILYMMGQLSLIGVIVNILILPLIPITMLVVFLAGVSGFISVWVSQIFGWMAHWLLSYELIMVEYFSEIPMASMKINKFSVSIVVATYIAYCIFFAFRAKFPGRSKNSEQ